MSVSDTLAERGARYGDFAKHAVIAQSLQTVMRGTDEDDWEGIGAEASMLTFEIFDAKKDGRVDHRERERLKSRCRTLIAKAEGALE